jgi:hypothetical protein
MAPESLQVCIFFYSIIFLMLCFCLRLLRQPHFPPPSSSLLPPISPSPFPSLLLYFPFSSTHLFFLFLLPSPPYPPLFTPPPSSSSLFKSPPFLFFSSISYASLPSHFNSAPSFFIRYAFRVMWKGPHPIRMQCFETMKTRSCRSILYYQRIKMSHCQSTKCQIGFIMTIL